MNITVTIEIGNDVFDSFERIEEIAYQAGLKTGCSLIKYLLETLDKKLMAERDSKRYRDKGTRKTCIKTICGSVEYERRVYLDLLAQEEGPRYVYLLDKELAISKIGTFTEKLCKLLASSVCESSYRAAARQMTDLSGQPISAQGAWNITQKLGKRQKERAEQNAELAKESQGKGIIETQLLYEENDGIWLHLQGESRKKHGRSKEMKVGIAYDGVIWKENKKGGKRRILNNKVAYAEFGAIKDFREKKEGLIASRFNVDAIDLRVVNGDGAAWIQKKKGDNTITVLDVYHRNRKIKECIKNPKIEESVREYLYAGEIDTLIEYIEAAINSVNDDEIEGLEELYKYYDENREALKGYYDRGIEIPPTRKPGELHHARLGSMESNIFTLIGKRMKGRRMNWSVEGGDNLASLLCAYHTVGMEALFAEMPGAPQIEEEWIDEGKPLAAKDNKCFSGKGYEYPVSVSTQSSPYWLRDISKMNGFTDLRF